MEKIERISVEGMRCTACAKAIESRVKKLNGVKDVRVNFATNSAIIKYDDSKISIEDVKKAIKQLGYGVVERPKEMFTKALTAIFGGILILFVSPVAQLIISTLIIIYSGSNILISAFKSLVNRILNMDVMYSIGILSSYTSSVFAFFSILPKDYIFFETPAMLIAFLSIGKAIEEKAKNRTRDSLSKLAALQTKKAIVLREREIEVETDEIREGDIVLVKPGERVPVDGTLISEYAEVDESAITGEPAIKYKKFGDWIFSGSISKSFLKIKAERVGKDTLISQIVRLVEDAMSSKAPIEKYADKVVSLFIPAVLTVALASFIYWYFHSPILGLTTLIATLVVACPCAFGLATPTAMAVALGKAAEKGILVKNSEVLEIASKVKKIFFDKTGTITNLNPEVVNADTETLRFAAIAELRSEHPIAKAILEKALELGIRVDEPEDFKYYEGKGVEALYKGERILVGSKKFMEENDIHVEFEEGVFVALNKRLIGVIEVADRLRDEAKIVVDELKKMGKEVVIVSGDGKKNVERIAKKLGVEYYAEMLPNEKAELIATHGGAFVGDGINDAAAIAKADVGIAVSKASEITIETADVISKFESIPFFFKLASKTMRKVKQNIFWAIIYNLILIPIAAGLLLPYGISLKPEFAALAMVVSSLCVVTNSLSLRWFE
ncbi:MAG: cation-translocating P-type ATPase [Archaeoglobaceae archaeon]